MTTRSRYIWLLYGLANACLVAYVPSLPWLYLVLIVPNSFKPFSDHGSHIGVETIWTTTSVHVRTHIHGEFDKVFLISNFGEAESIAAATNMNPAITDVLRDIQKSSLIFTIILRLLVLLTLTSALLPFCHSSPPPPRSPASQQIGFGTLTIQFLDPEGSPLEIPNHPTYDHERNEPGLVIPKSPSADSPDHPATLTFNWLRQGLAEHENGLRFHYLISIGAGFLGLVAAITFIVTLAIDSAALMPGLVRNLRLLCLTHSADSCRVESRSQSGLWLFGGLMIFQFCVSTIAYTRSKPEMPQNTINFTRVQSSLRSS